jgi:hypothetical protein
MKHYSRFSRLTMNLLKRPFTTQKQTPFVLLVLLLFVFVVQEAKGEIHYRYISSVDDNSLCSDLSNEMSCSDTLIPPQLIPNPQNDDELFFNFKLVHFAPASETLIKETFGNTLQFGQDGFWEYNSYNSHAVGFNSNLPTISVIEYGTTIAYGQTTEQSDSYYYNHLHYIKGLQSNTTYHYRILIQDYDGTIITSDDYSFTTKTFTPDIIRIPDDMTGSAPYTLTSDNTTYVLTQDLTVPTLAINIKAHNVEIDLNGHTIVYDNGTPEVIGTGWTDYDYNERATYGIRGGLWNMTNIKIMNGVIKQGSNGGQGFVGAGFNPIYTGPLEDYIASEHEIAGITADYYAANANGIRAGRGKFHHNVIIDRGTLVEDRHLGINALSTGNDPNTEVAYNSIRRFRHQGIMGSGYKHHNEVYSDSYATNSFLIGVKDSNRIEYNKMFGTGFNPVGTSWASHTMVNHNFIYMQGTAPNQRSNEYERLSGVAGLRYTLYDTTNYYNSVYEDNTIIVKAWAGCTVARGIWTGTGRENNGSYYRRNIVKTELLSYDSINFDMVELAISAVEINGNLLDFDSPLPVPAIFEDNTLIGNVNLIAFGAAYGVGSNSHFYRTKLEKINHHDNYFYPVRLGYFPFNTFNNKMIDNELGEGVIIDPPKFHHLGASAGYMEIDYGVSHELVVIDSCTNKPLKNTNISIALNDRERILTAKTDNEGILKFDLLTVRNTSRNSIPSRTEYVLYTFEIDSFLPYSIATLQLMDTDTIIAIRNDCSPLSDRTISAPKTISCYPNPVQDRLNISGLSGKEDIIINDISGRTLYMYKSDGATEMQIPISGLASGMYFVRISTSTKTKTMKIIKQ